MVASIVAKESSFKSQIVSPAGAIGLMQLRAFVAEDVARREGIPWKGRETLHTPDLNVRLGILYFKDLLHSFDGDQAKALTAYNLGPTRVHQELREGNFIASRYARRVMDLYEQLDRQRPTSVTTRSST